MLPCFSYVFSGDVEVVFGDNIPIKGMSLYRADGIRASNVYSTNSISDASGNYDFNNEEDCKAVIDYYILKDDNRYDPLIFDKTITKLNGKVYKTFVNDKEFKPEEPKVEVKSELEEPNIKKRKNSRKGGLKNR